jgi:hypothetical protein
LCEGTNRIEPAESDACFIAEVLSKRLQVRTPLII